MICVSIGRGRRLDKQMIAEHARLVEDGIQLVELRLDYIQRAVSLQRLLADKLGPCRDHLSPRIGWRPMGSYGT